VWSIKLNQELSTLYTNISLADSEAVDSSLEKINQLSEMRNNFVYYMVLCSCGCGISISIILYVILYVKSKIGAVFVIIIF
jgi:hypothetical protein